MVNRAFVVFETEDTRQQVERSPAVYLHRHGAPESVYAFLQYLHARSVSLADPAFVAASFTQVVGNFCGGAHALGLHNIDNELDLLKWQAAHGIYLFRHAPAAFMEVTIRRIVFDPQQGGNRWLSDAAVAEELALARQHISWQVHDAKGQSQVPILTRIARCNDQFFCASPIMEPCPGAGC